MDLYLPEEDVSELTDAAVSAVIAAFGKGKSLHQALEVVIIRAGFRGACMVEKQTSPNCKSKGGAE